MTDDFDTDRYCTPKEGLAPVYNYWPLGIDYDPCWDPDGVVVTNQRCDLRESVSGSLYTDWGEDFSPDVEVSIYSVWLNPPYSETGNWTWKAVYEARRYSHLEIISLLPSNTDAKWWHEDVIPNARALCYRRGRLKFLKRGTQDRKPRGANVYALFGGHSRSEREDERELERFRAIFGRVGHVEILR